MKPLFSFAVFATLFFISCNNNESKVQTELLRADRLMDEFPDSSLLLLEQIYFPESLPSRDYARYCLLMTQARDKNYLSLAGDSLIDKAVAFYETSEDSLSMSLSYFYLSRRDFQDQNLEKSMVACLKSLDCTGSSAPRSLLGLINSHLGVLHLEERNFDQALSFFRRSYLHYSKDLNLEREIFSLREMGKVFMLSNKMDSSFFYYKHAEELSDKTGNIRLKSMLLNDLAVLYQLFGENDRAREYLFHSLEIEDDSVRLGKRYFTLAELYLAESKPDSAWIYFNTSQRLDNIYTLSAVLNAKYEWAKRTGCYIEALNYSDKLREVKDSIALIVQNMEVSEEEQKYHYEKLKNEHISKELKHETTMKRFFLSLFCIVVLLILVIIAYCYMSKYKNEKIREQKEEMDRMTQKEQEVKNIIFTKTEIAKKVKSISLANPDPKKLLDTKDKLITSQEWNELILIINDTHNDFTNRLKKKYPKMKKDDIRLCCLIKLERSISDISLFLNINPGSVSTKKTRLKLSKMKLDKTVDFDRFIVDF